MRRSILGAFAVGMLFFLIPAPQSHAQGRYYHGGGGWHGGTHVVVGVGPAWGYGLGWGPGWYYPPPYGYPYAYGPTVVVQPPPPQYVQQAPQEGSLPAGYWYYCASARGYYPNVPNCPEAWIQVPPAPQAK